MLDDSERTKSALSPPATAAIALPNLQRACLIRRYQRFLADVRLADGEEVTLHCPNTGRMTGCAEPGWGVWFSLSANPQRKYSRTWELSESAAGHLIGINTTRANELVAQAIRGGGWGCRGMVHGGGLSNWMCAASSRRVNLSR